MKFTKKEKNQAQQSNNYAKSINKFSVYTHVSSRVVGNSIKH